MLGNTYVSLIILFQIASTTDISLFANQNEYKEVESTKITQNWARIIQPSIFNNVPPFIRFSFYTDPKVIVPQPIQKSLIWCQTVPLVNKVVNKTGLKLVPNLKCRDWIGFFNGKVTGNRQPKSVLKKSYQRYNRFPGAEELCNKDKLWLNARKKISKFGIDDFDFFFDSYAYPSEIFQFYQRNIYKPETWIFKPSRTTLNRGIELFMGFAKFPRHSKWKSAVIQKYLIESHRLNGFRLRYRTYIVVTSFRPLRIYLYQDGDTNLELRLHDPEELFARNENILNYWQEQGFNTTEIKTKIEDAIIKLMFVGEKKIADRCFKHLENKYNAYQFWTADFTFDESLQPLLFELNSYGSLGFDHEEPARVKIPMLTETLNLAGYHFPPTLSKEARALLHRKLIRIKPEYKGGVVFGPELYSFDKSRNGTEKQKGFNHLGFQNRSSYVENILENLEASDVRELMIAEDELARTVNYQRIFPTKTTFRYLKYLESDPYYYMLQDAWEQKYSGNRSAGIQLLNEYWETLLQGIRINKSITL